MAYSIDNPPALVSQLIGKNGGSKWVYDSPDAATLVRVNGYISNGYDLGMKVGDIVDQIDTAGGTISHAYTVVQSSKTGVDLSNGVAAAVTDTD